jgi:FxsC-like protein
LATPRTQLGYHRHRECEAISDANMIYDFFVSCAAENVKRVAPFLDELFDEIHQRAGLRGYFYRSPKLIGTSWPVEAAQALRNCKVFIPIYSHHFFKSPTCDREYAAFLNRLELSGLSTGQVLPIVWMRPPDGVPQTIKDIVDSRFLLNESERHLDFAAIYAQKNLEDSPYAKLVVDLAQLVVERFKESAPIRTDLSVNLLEGPTIFGVQASSSGAVADRARAVRRVHFAPIAGTRGEMDSLTPRQATHFYGHDRVEWTPFAPQSVEPAVHIAEELARSEGLTPDDVRELQDLVEYVKRQEESMELVILLVDPWAVHVPTLAEQLAEYDGRRWLNSGALILVSSTDEETQVSLPQLRDSVLPRMAADGESFVFQRGVSDVDSFRTALKRAILELRKRAQACAPPAFVAEAGISRQIPVLASPSELA